MSIVKSLQKAVYENPVTVDVIQPETWRGADWSPDWFFGGQGIDYHFSYTGHTNAANAYEICSPLTSIINKQAQADINGKPWILNNSGKSKGKESTSEFANRMRKLLANPNPLQTWRKFEAVRKVYVKVFGWCFVMPVYPVGWEKYGLIEATSLWLIPPFMLDITESDKLFFQSGFSDIVKTVKLKYRNLNIELQVKDLVLFSDFVPSMQDLVFPESRILSLRMNVNNIIGAMESRNSLINHAGAQGIFSPGSDNNGPLPLLPQAKEDLQKDFRRYGLKKDQWKYIFAPTQLTWQQVGRPTRDLMLFEEIQDDIMRICDSYNHPYRLLSQESNSLGGADLKVHTRNLYMDAIIPDAEADSEVWNNAFKCFENGVRYEKDFSHIDALQEDKLLNAQAELQQNNSCKVAFFNNLITFNRWREKIGEDTLAGLPINGTEITDAGNMFYYQLVELGMKFGEVKVPVNTNENGTGNEQETNSNQSSN